MTTTPCPTRPLDRSRPLTTGHPSGPGRGTTGAPPTLRQQDLDDLADAAAGAEGHLGAEVLAGAVARLEALAGAPLGPVAGEPLVVLQRRAGRALRLLAGRAPAVDAGRLAGLATDLREPAAALLRASAATGSAGGPR
ncbi:hypothetical protein [uncultured Pseudokineococcus sp.]|uniref:hypothetical protein n=1 Tax=uncultured Pseudokineococcus sp. TaxID=1642928 RepID=UPI00262D3225|nr:hypothetical protein [uncultured Pseudokineococcus sp.]